jgi:hypothetical protein
VIAEPAAPVKDEPSDGPTTTQPVEDAAVRTAARNVDPIAQLLREQQYSASVYERVGTAISRVAGTITFVIWRGSSHVARARGS